MTTMKQAMTKCWICKREIEYANPPYCSECDGGTGPAPKTKTREMRWQQFWRERDVYWSRAEQHKHESGSFPEWVFDFISIHHHYEGGFRLLSPLCIANRDDQFGSRPRWEQKTFETLGKAIAVSRRLARLYSRSLNQRIHVIYCPAAPSIQS